MRGFGSGEEVFSAAALVLNIDSQHRDGQIGRQTGRQKRSLRPGETNSGEKRNEAREDARVGLDGEEDGVRAGDGDCYGDDVSVS